MGREQNKDRALVLQWSRSSKQSLKPVVHCPSGGSWDSLDGASKLYEDIVMLSSKAEFRQDEPSCKPKLP